MFIRKFFLSLILALVLLSPAYAATRTSVGSGNWSDAGTWDVKPTTGDDAVIATGHAVALNENTASLNSLTFQGTGTLTVDLTVGNLSILATTITGGTVGAAGAIQVTGTTNNTLTITGNIAQAATATIYFNSNGYCVFTGNIAGSNSSNMIAVRNYGAGRWTINGNLTGGSGLNSHVWSNRITGTLALTGNVTGGGASSDAPAFGIKLEFTSTGAVSITGDITGGSGVGNMGVVNLNTGTVTFVGNLINSANAVAYGGTPPSWSPAATNYHQYGAVKLAPEVSAANLKLGVQNGTVTGTLVSSSVFGTSP